MALSKTERDFIIKSLADTHGVLVPEDMPETNLLVMRRPWQ